jgi:hypothetical protein
MQLSGIAVQSLETNEVYTVCGNSSSELKYLPQAPHAVERIRCNSAMHGVVCDLTLSTDSGECVGDGDRRRYSVGYRRERRDRGSGVYKPHLFPAFPSSRTHASDV